MKSMVTYTEEVGKYVSIEALCTHKLDRGSDKCLSGTPQSSSLNFVVKVPAPSTATSLKAFWILILKLKIHQFMPKKPIDVKHLLSIHPIHSYLTDLKLRISSIVVGAQ